MSRIPVSAAASVNNERKIVGTQGLLNFTRRFGRRRIPEFFRHDREPGPVSLEVRRHDLHAVFVEDALNVLVKFGIKSCHLLGVGYINKEKIRVVSVPHYLRTCFDPFSGKPESLEIGQPRFLQPCHNPVDQAIDFHIAADEPGPTVCKIRYQLEQFADGSLCLGRSSHLT